jgi:hypothetical protein
LRFPYKIKDFKTVQKNFDYLTTRVSEQHVAVRRVAVQSIANNTFTSTEDLVWDAADDSNSKMWTSGSASLSPRMGFTFLPSE